MNTRISNKLDKLLLEKGIDTPVNPTIADVVMWMYEKRKAWIVVSYELNSETSMKGWFWVMIENGEETAYQYKGFRSPKEAYEAAIEYFLINLIKP